MYDDIIKFYLLFHVFASRSYFFAWNKMNAIQSAVYLFVLLQVVLCDKYHAKSQAGKTQAFAKEGKFLTTFWETGM